MDWDELRALRDRVEELSTELRGVHARLQNLERDAEREQGAHSMDALRPPVTLPPPLPPAPPAGTGFAAEEGAPPGGEALAAFRPVPAPPRAKTLAGPGPLLLFWRRIGPPADLSWEMALGTWWLPRIGMVVLAVAVVWLLTLAMGQIPPAWLPGIRLGLGAAVCVALLVLGKFLEKRAETYARVLLAGGIALSYLVAFATHYLPFTQVFDSAVPTLLLLAGIVAFWTAVAQWRHSRLLGLGVTLLGHLTIGLSTFTLAEPHSLAVAGLVALAAGSAFFLWRNGWIVIAMAGVLGAYGNYLLWLAESPASGTVVAFVSAMAVLVVFFLLFALADFFAPAAFRREHAGYRLRTLHASLNAVGLVGLGALLMQGFDFARPHDYLFYLAAGAVMLALSAGYARLRDADPLYHAYLTKGIVVATIGGVALFEGGRLLATFALEGLALLIASRRPGMLATRILALLAAGAACVYGALLWQDAFPGLSAGETLWGARVTLGLSALALLAMAEVYRRTDWSRFSPASAPFNLDTNRMLWQLDLIAEMPGGTAIRKPLGGLLIPYILATAGAALLWAFTPGLAPITAQAPVLAGVGVVLLAAAVSLASAPLGLGALVIAAAAWLRYVPLIFADAHVFYTALTLALLAPQALACEWPHFGRREGLRLHQAWPMPYLLYPALGFAGMLLCFAVLGDLPRPFGAERLTVVFGLLAWAAALFTLVLHRRAVGLVSTGYLFLAAAMWALYSSQIDGESLPRTLWHLTLWGLVASIIAVERLFALHGADRLMRAYGAALLVLGGLLIARYLGEAAPEVLVHALLGIAAIGFLAYAAVTQRRTALAVGLALGVGDTLWLLWESFEHALGNNALLAGFGVIILFWGLLERAYAWLAGRLRIPVGDEASREGIALVLTGVPVALLVVLLERLPAIGDGYLSIAWTIAAVAAFGASLLFRQPYYRYAGLTIFALVLARVFLVDTARLEPVLRIAAGAVLGGVMLAVGYGYVYARQRASEARKE